MSLILQIVVLAFITLATGNPIVTSERAHTLVPRANNYAMVCFMSRDVTNFCASPPESYYCNARGALANNQQEPPYIYNEFCEDTCECYEVAASVPKPCVIGGASGSCYTSKEEKFAGFVPDVAANETAEATATASESVPAAVLAVA